MSRQRVCEGEPIRDGLGYKFVEPVNRVICDAHEHRTWIRLGIDVGNPGIADQAIGRRGTFVTPSFRIEEQGVPAPEDQTAQRVLVRKTTYGKKRGKKPAHWAGIHEVGQELTAELRPIQ